MNESESPPLPQPSPVSAPTGPAPRRALAWLALLVALAALAAAGWTFRALELAQQRLRAVELDLAERPSAASSDRVVEIGRRVDAAEKALATLEVRTTELGSAQRALQQSATATGGEDRELGEAEYLQRLAAQSLLMGREVRGAIALLQASDEILHARDDPALHDARAQLARDLAALREVADFDIEGAWLQLSALEGAIANLATAAPAPPVAETAAPAPPEQGWGARVEAILERYVTIRRDAPGARPLMSVIDEQLLRLDIRLALEQAKLAVLSGDQAVYATALADADQLTRSNFGASTAASRAFLDELARLEALRVAPQLPDLSVSLRELREARKRLGAPAG